MKLFKYRTHNLLSTSSLVNHYSWYSNPFAFNDPFDYTLLANKFIQERFLNTQNVFCLSEENDNLLLWSHYADSHRGYCVEYTDYSDEEISYLKSKAIFPENVPNHKLSIVRNALKVEYLNDKQIDDYISQFPEDDVELLKQWKKKQNEDKEEEYLTEIRRNFLIKHEIWSYEKERRIMVENKNTLIPPGKITAIYFGMRMPPIDKRTIATIAFDKFKGNCSLFTMYRNGNGYKLGFREFNPKLDFAGLDLKL